MGRFSIIGYFFENNRLLFSGNFCGGQGLDGGDKVVMGNPPVPKLGKTLESFHTSHYVVGMILMSHFKEPGLFI